MTETIKRYKSKVDTWLVCVIAGAILISAIPVLIYEFSWTAAIVMTTTLVLLIWLLFNIYYIITENILTVSYAGIIRQNFRICDITKISPTNSILSAPAASLDRIAVYFKDRRLPLIISPKQKKEFIDTLILINGDIIYNHC